MKYFTAILIVSIISSFLVGCGGSDEVSAPEAVTEITIQGNDRMRFHPTHFTVRAGETITLTLENVGRMPKETMGHNLAILEKSVNANAFAAASIGAAPQDYIAPEYADRVIAATGILGPGETEVITFTAPAAPGEYPFVCSFPGHTPAGMKGIMEVVE